MTVQVDSELEREDRHGWLLSVPALAGIGFALSWLIGLSVFAASTTVRSSGAELLEVYTGHRTVAMVQFVFTEGAPAVALALVVLALGGVAAGRLRRAVLATGLAAVVVSLVQCVLGLYLTGSLVPDRNADSAVTVFETINRLDGAKMLLLAGLAVAGFVLIRHVGLPRWLASVALALAAAIAVSGVGYLFLLGGPAVAAWISLPLLVVWVTGVGVALARRRR